jgi:hypothetical protein
VRGGFGAEEGIGLPDFLDEVPPLLGRDAAGLVVGDIDDFDLLNRPKKFRKIPMRSFPD